MKESSVSGQDILQLVETIGESTEAAAAAIGVATELAREINKKVPLHDLLEQVVIFSKNELGPTVKSIQDYVWSCRKRAATEILGVFEQYSRAMSGEHALQLTMATLGFWERTDAGLAKSFQDGAKNSMTTTK